MASPLDFWSLIPYFALAWIAACGINLAKFAYAEAACLVVAKTTP